MIKRFKKKPERFFYRTNERIFAQSLRVLDSQGKQIGVLSKFEALNKAQSLGLDLVEIAPKAQPPVAKIIDFKKFLYQLAKKKREERKKAKVSETKEIRLGPFMDNHDLEVMIRRGREFLANGDKVRLVVKFIGRQIAHPEFGKEVLNKVILALSDISKIERESHFEGKQLIAIITPEKKSAKGQLASGGKEEDENENQKVSQQAV